MIKLEIGKTYVNRLGEQITITRKIDHPTYPFLGVDDEHERGFFAIDGRYYHFGDEDVFDLVEEVKEE